MAPGLRGRCFRPSLRALSLARSGQEAGQLGRRRLSARQPTARWFSGRWRWTRSVSTERPAMSRVARSLVSVTVAGTSASRRAAIGERISLERPLASISRICSGMRSISGLRDGFSLVTFIHMVGGGMGCVARRWIGAPGRPALAAAEDAGLGSFSRRVAPKMNAGSIRN